MAYRFPVSERPASPPVAVAEFRKPAQGNEVSFGTAGHATSMGMGMPLRHDDAPTGPSAMTIGSLFPTGHRVIARRLSPRADRGLAVREDFGAGVSRLHPVAA